MNEVDGVEDGSCTDCDGTASADCAAATCNTDYHTFADGVGCSGLAASSLNALHIGVPVPYLHARQATDSSHEPLSPFEISCRTVEAGPRALQSCHCI